MSLEMKKKMKKLKNITAKNRKGKDKSTTKQTKMDRSLKIIKLLC